MTSLCPDLFLVPGFIKKIKKYLSLCKNKQSFLRQPLREWFIVYKGQIGRVFWRQTGHFIPECLGHGEQGLGTGRKFIVVLVEVVWKI